MPINLSQTDFLFLRSLKANHFKLFLVLLAAFFVGAGAYCFASAKFWRVFLTRSAKSAFQFNAEISQCGLKIHFVCAAMGFFGATAAHFFERLFRLFLHCVVRIDFSQERVVSDGEFDKTIPMSADFLENSENERLSAENAEIIRFVRKYRAFCLGARSFWVILAAIHYSFAVFLTFFEKTAFFFQRAAFCAIFSAAILLSCVLLSCAINRHFSVERLESR